ncbi:MAG: CpsD/CapB family tyrosine-protein kinase [Candidatus Thiodiazotropha taylori]
MEKIKQALERAREAHTPISTNRQYGKSVSQTPEVDTTTKIKYTETKTVKISKENLKEKRVILGDKNDSVLDQYKVLRTRILQRLKSNKWNSLAVTSPTEGCGKTLTSLNLAISLAQEVNHSVLLVDLDLRRPCIHSYFYEDVQPGISEYLTDDKELSELLFNPGLERLVVLPGNKSFINSSEMLSSPKMVKLVKELKTRYPNRIIIFDMPPVLSCDDVLAFSPYVDAVMLVIEDGRTNKTELKKAIELIDDKNFIGSVLNKSCSDKTVYSYY